MRRATIEQFRRWIRGLRESCPTIVPVRVRRRALREMDGYSSLIFDEKDRPHHFIIVVHEDMCSVATDATLIHEWAHCLSWNEGHRTLCHHDANWGVMLAHIYGEVSAP